jgi:hypothetical protein
MAEKPNDATADTGVVVETDVKLANVGVPTPRSLRILAEDLPEKDTVQKATKAAMLADTAQQEAKEKAKAVDASPNAADTPSGGALKKVTGVANDTERGEKYLREKTARRWGYVPVDEA